jgi:hypothetical protein
LAVVIFIASLFDIFEYNAGYEGVLWLDGVNHYIIVRVFELKVNLLQRIVEVLHNEGLRS